MIAGQLVEIDEFLEEFDFISQIVSCGAKIHFAVYYVNETHNGSTTCKNMCTVKICVGTNRGWAETKLCLQK